MKKIILSLGLIILAIPFICLASFSIKEWQYYKDINSSQTGLISISLDNEIFSGAKKNLSDLRIIKDAKEEIPYKLAVSKDETSYERFYPKMLNNSFAAGESSFVILELEEGKKEINQLKINTSAENFQRNVKIYGSDDKLMWNVLNDNEYIYNYTDKKANFSSQNTTVNFPNSIFRYIKIEISNIENNPVRISNVEGIKYKKKKSKEVISKPKFSININAEEKVSEIIADLGFSGIPTNAILLSARDDNFNRSVLVYSSNDREKWRYNSNGYIFRYDTQKFRGEHLKLDINETTDRYIKIVIQNKDNQALDIYDLAAFSQYREILFQGQRGSNYRLYYGGKKAVFPEYDLDKYFQYLDLTNVSEAFLSEQKNNPEYTAPQEPLKPLTERVPYLLSAVLIIISLALMFFVYKFLKK